MEKQKRRTKNGFEGELLKCGCGKQYLSFPALYAHIKAKHDGVAPEGTDTKPSKEPVSKTIKCGCGKLYQSFASMHNHIKTSHDGVAPEGTDQKHERKKPKISTQKQDFLEENKFNGESSLDELDYKHPLIDLAYTKAEHPKNCERVFANYLHEMTKVINLETFKAFAKYTCLLYECLNLRGWEMDKESNTEEYCKVKSPESVPKMANFFITTYLPFQEEDPALASKFCEHFCNWLYSKKFTSLSLSPYS